MIRTEIFKAQKPHICHWCNFVISPGDRYNSVIAVGESDWTGMEFVYWKECWLCYPLESDIRRTMES